MIILSDCFDYAPMLVDAKKLESLWRGDSLYISRWGGAPREKWFLMDDDGKKIAFIAGLASMHMGAVRFTNGRHRTRWLLELGMDVIPLCVPYYEVEQWTDLEIIVQSRNPIRVRNLKSLVESAQ